MRLTPEAMDYIDRFNLCGGQISWGDTDNIQNLDYEIFLLMRDCQAVASDIQSKMSGSGNFVYSKEAYMRGGGRAY